MRVLLIWEDIPETTRFFVIDDPSDKELEYLEEANGLFINADDETDGLQYVYTAICNPEYAGDYVTYLDFCKASVWFHKEQESPIDGPIDKVFWCGFIA